MCGIIQLIKYYCGKQSQAKNQFHNCTVRHQYVT
jgi:hypothetical protein